MSEATTDRARPYPAALKDEIADLKQEVLDQGTKVDVLIRHWADAAEMTKIMEECRATVTEAHKVNHDDTTKLHHQLNLLLTPIAEEPPTRWRRVLWSGVVLIALLVSFWLGGLAPWARTETRRLDAFLADVHTTLAQRYPELPKAVQEQLQEVYREHKYEALRAAPQEKK